MSRLSRNNSVSLRSKAAVLAAIAAIAIIVQGAGSAAAAAAAETGQPAVVQTSAESGAAIAEKFRKELQQSGRIPDAFDYLSGNIAKAGPYYGGLMVLYLENAITGRLPVMSKRFAAADMQTAIAKAYAIGDSLQAVMSKTKNTKLKKLLAEAAADGYKLETTEGFFFPMIDYKRFQPFKAKAAPDIRAYIDIMTVQTGQLDLQDGSLTIGYQELVRRALAEEKFAASYPNSNRAAQVDKLFARHRTLTFRGIDNTPLFQYGSYEMQPNARKGYSLMLTWNDAATSPYLTLLDQFMTLAKAGNYKQTSAIDKFIEKNVPDKL